MATRWREHLEAWAIPPDILAAAPADPWAHPVSRFAGRADRAVAEADGVSFERAAEVLRHVTGFGARRRCRCWCRLAAAPPVGDRGDGGGHLTAHARRVP